MSIFDADGGRIVVATKSRLQTTEDIELRDRKVIEALCELGSTKAVARMFRITPQFVRKIRNRINPVVRSEIIKEVKARHRDRIENMSVLMGGR